MSDPSSGVEERRGDAARRLLTAGVALSVASIAAVVIGRLTWVANSNGYAGGQEPLDLVIADLLEAVGPSGLTGGIVCIGLAVAVRALRVTPPAIVENATSESRDPVRVPSFSLRDEHPDPHPGSSRPIDPEAFKRPRSDRHPAS